MNINRIFILFIFILVPQMSWGTSWEMAVIFLGQHESQSYHQDIDYNVIELSRFVPTTDFKLSIFRGFGSRWYTYTPDPRPNSPLFAWDELFFKLPEGVNGPISGIQIPGFINSYSGPARLFLDSKRLKKFLFTAFKDPAAKRLLMIYGHGKAYAGLRQVDLIDLEKMIDQNMPPRRHRKDLDITWFNSCFMGSIEVANQFKNITDYMIVSQDAEFASAAPALDQFDIFSRGKVSEVAVKIAKRYLESYSATWNGSQRRYIVESPATLSVIETSKLAPLVADLKLIKDSLYPISPQLKRQLSINLKDIKMSGKDDLVDMGFLLKILGRSTLVAKKSKKLLKRINKKYGFRQLSRRKTSPRVKFKKGQTIVFGFDNWSGGFKSDTKAQIPNDLKPDGYFRAADGKLWPFKTFNKSLRLVPFSARHQEFNFYDFNASSQRRSGEKKTIKRIFDLSFFAQQSPQSPILFNGYTEALGNYSERYTGLNILSPLSPHLDGRYFDTDFSISTDWQQLTK